MNNLLARLLLVVAIAVVPALAFQAYTEYQARQTRQQVLEDKAQRLAGLVSAGQHEIIEGAGQLLAALSAVSFIRKTDPEPCQRFLADLGSTMRRYDGIAVIGLDGRLLCASVPYDPHPDIADRAYFQKAIASDTFVVGE
jgi:hypothetical protein